MNSPLSSSQQKIYSEKSLLADKQLLEIINNPNDYISDVVIASRLILEERGVLQKITEAEQASEEEIISKKKPELLLSVDGAPYDKSFKIISTNLILLYIIAVIFYRIIPAEKEGLSYTIYAALAALTLYSTYLSYNYLKQINRDFGLAILCFFAPVIGLLFVKYAEYKFKYPEAKQLYLIAVDYYNAKSKQLTNSLKNNSESPEQFKERINQSINQKIKEFSAWLETEKNNNALQGERDEKLKDLVAEYQHEREPLPIADLTFKTYEPEEESAPENLSQCPACGFSLTPGLKVCPDCGISLS